MLEGEEKSIKEIIKTIEKDARAFIDVKRRRKEKYRDRFTDFERKGTDVFQELEEKSTKEIFFTFS